MVIRASRAPFVIAGSMLTLTWANALGAGGHDAASATATASSVV